MLGCTKSHLYCHIRLPCRQPGMQPGRIALNVRCRPQLRDTVGVCGRLPFATSIPRHLSEALPLPRLGPVSLRRGLPQPRSNLPVVIALHSPLSCPRPLFCRPKGASSFVSSPPQRGRTTSAAPPPSVAVVLAAAVAPAAAQCRRAISLLEAPTAQPAYALWLARSGVAAGHCPRVVAACSLRSNPTLRPAPHSRSYLRPSATQARVFRRYGWPRVCARRTLLLRVPLCEDTS
jgi:hypothetical protein